MKMIIQHGIPTHAHGEDLGEFLQTFFDPGFAIMGTFAQQESAAHTASHAVIPASETRIDKMSTSNRHGGQDLHG